MLQLRKLSIAGYKSIKNLKDLELRGLNIIVGANGAGKSNLLSFFRLLNFAMTESLQDFIVTRSGGANSLLHYGSENTQQVRASLEFVTDEDAINRYNLRLSYAAPDTLVFTEESLSFLAKGKQGPWEGILDAGGKESRLPATAAVRGGNVPPKVKTARFFKSTLSGFRFFQFHDTSETSRMRARSAVDIGHKLYSGGENLAACLYRIQEEQPLIYRNIVSLVRNVAPFIGDFVLRKEGDYPGSVLLRWRTPAATDYEFGPHQLSDGTLRLIALVTLLSLPPAELPPMIAIDEPELGLHPEALALLAELIKQAADHCQVLISTQSTVLLDYFKAEDVIVAAQDQGASTFRRLKADEYDMWLDEYKLGDLLRKNVLDAGPRHA